MHSLEKLSNPMLLASIDGFVLPAPIQLPGPFGPALPQRVTWDYDATAYLPQWSETRVDQRARFLLARALVTAVALEEASSARRHAVVLGTRFTRVLLCGTHVVVELNAPDVPIDTVCI